MKFFTFAVHMNATPELELLKEELASLKKEMDKAINDGKSADDLKPIVSRVKLITGLIERTINSREKKAF